MRRRKLLGWVVGVPLVVTALILIIVFHEPEKEGMDRAAAARSVALAVCAPAEFEDWAKERRSSHFPAESMEQWYVPYFDYLYEQGILTEEAFPATEKMAEGRLTCGEARRIAEAVDASLAQLIPVTKKNRDKAYAKELWWLFYDSLLKCADPEGQVQEKAVLVYGTPENVPSAPAWTAYTNLGELGFAGLSLDAYVDHELTALVRDQELIHVIADKGQDVTYRNVWLAGGGKDGLEVYVGDIRRTIPFGKPSKKTDELIHNLADIELSDGKITKVSLKKERIEGKILAVGEDAIEIEGYGAVPLDDEYKIFKTYGELERQKVGDILVGGSNQEIIAAKGKICAVLTVRAYDADTIRVLLLSQDFRGACHDTVSMVCEKEMTVLQGSQESRIEAGQELTFTVGDERLAGGRMIFTPAEGAEIRVTSLARAQGCPSYSGRLELLDTADGLVLVNELYLEDYLKKVVPSEMPASYEKEALKAQAVCARTYAYVQLQSNSYSGYGAHIDDSTNFQVYNNIETNARTAEAVDETYGKMLLYDGKPVSAYYFSTSCGTTTDATVWGMDPAEAPYLKSVALQPGRKTLDLRTNEAFGSFIKKTDGTAYDSGFPYYRWQVTTNADVLTANIGGVGQVESVRITERGAGGVAKTMLVSGSEGEKTISGQNAIRSALGDASLTIHRADGKTVDGWNSLPSGFLTIEGAGTSESGVKQFKIYGGGYGHGAGMSQNGAQGMAKAGMDYREILNFFYEGVTIEEIK